MGFTNKTIFENSSSLAVLNYNSNIKRGFPKKLSSSNLEAHENILVNEPTLDRFRGNREFDKTNEQRMNNSF